MPSRERLDQVRRSLHQLNNDLSVASVSLELISIKLDQAADPELADQVRQACDSAKAAVKRAGQIAKETLHELAE